MVHFKGIIEFSKIETEFSYIRFFMLNFKEAFLNNLG
jgi:hypothetical protein